MCCVRKSASISPASGMLLTRASWAGMCPGKTGECRQEAERTHSPWKQVCEVGFSPSCPCYLTNEDVPWRAVSPPETALGSQTRSRCGRTQYLGDLLSHDDHW